MEQVDAGEQMRKCAESPSGGVVLFTTLETPTELDTTKNTLRKPAFRALSNLIHGLHSSLQESSYDLPSRRYVWARLGLWRGHKQVCVCVGGEGVTGKRGSAPSELETGN